MFGKLGNAVSQSRAQSQASEGDLANATLTGNTGLSATSLGNLFSAPVFFCRECRTCSISAPTTPGWRFAALTAFQQTKDNLAAIAAYADVSRSRDDAATSADKAETIARNQYLSGIVDYTTVITAQSAAFSARQTRIEAVVNCQAATVALVQAIGGSWVPVAP